MKRVVGVLRQFKDASADADDRTPTAVVIAMRAVQLSDFQRCPTQRRKPQEYGRSTYILVQKAYTNEEVLLAAAIELLR